VLWIVCGLVEECNTAAEVAQIGFGRAE